MMQLEKTSRVYKTIVVVLMIALLGACSKDVADDPIDTEDPSYEIVEGFDIPKTEDVDGGSITYQYKKGVLVVDELAESYLVKVVDDSVLFYSKNTPQDILPKVGDVLSARVSSKIPYGLGNKVISNSEEDGLLKFVTTVTTLDNVFEVLSWDFKSYLTDSISETNTEIESIWYDETTDECYRDVNRSLSARNGYSRVKLLSFPIDIDKLNGIDVDGDLSVGLLLHCSGDIKKDNFDIYINPIINLDTEIKVGLIYKKEFDHTKYSILNKSLFNRILQIGVLTLRPNIHLKVDAEVGASGALSLHLDKTYSSVFGYSYAKKGYFENSTKDTSDDQLIKTINIDGNLGLGIETLVDFSCGFYTKRLAISLDPSLELKADADLRLTENPLAWTPNGIELNLDVSGKGAIVVDLFGKLRLLPTFELFKTKLWQKELPLLPALKEKSLSVKKDNSCESLKYIAKYELKKGLLTNQWLKDKLYIIPSFRVYEGSEEIYHIIDEQGLSGESVQEFTFELEDLEEDKTYVGKPSLMIKDNLYDAIDSISFPAYCNNENHPHTVDLGLPSGILWSCVNVGASVPSDFGDYCILSSDKDIATEKMGDGYYTPTIEQMKELVSNTKQHEVTVNGVAGVLFKANNGNSIFMPAAAQLWWDEENGAWSVNNKGTLAYWTKTASKYKNYMYFLEYNDESHRPIFGDRKITNNKLTIRPIYIQPEK